MKKLLISVVVCAATLSFNAIASLKFVGDTEYAALCEAAATNNLDMFKSNVKQHAFYLRKSKRDMLNLLASGDNFQCAGQSIPSFAQARGAVDVANYITSENADQQVASTSKYKFVGDTNYKNFCKAAVTNNVALFERAVSSQVGRIGSSKKEVMDKVLES